MPRRYYSSIAQRTTLAAPLSSGATTMIVASTTGFPGTRPFTLVIDPDTIKEEIVTVTAASGTTLTITRAEDGTSASAHDLGATVWHGFTGRDLGEPQAHMDSSSGVHGRTGEVVGDTDTQTLSNKTMSGADNTFTDIPQSAVTNLPSDLAAKAPINSPTFTGNPVLPASTTLGDLSPTEIAYLNGVTSNVQTQLDSKAPIASPSFTGTVSLPSDTSIGGVSAIEISRLAGVAGNIQSQIDGITGGGVAVPPGGDTDWVLVKNSAADYDMAWRPLSSIAFIPGASGNYVVTDGAITGGDSTGTYTSGAYTYRWHKFTTAGTVMTLDCDEEVVGTLLLVGGGGAGGVNSLSGNAGGGGGGGYYENIHAFGLGTHTCWVGTGGIYGAAGGMGNPGNGGHTYFDGYQGVVTGTTLMAYGGGRGGSGGNLAGQVGWDGGSGGGGGKGQGGGTWLGGSLDGGATNNTTLFRGSNGGAAGPTGSGIGGGAGGVPGTGWTTTIAGASEEYSVGWAGAAGFVPSANSGGGGAAGIPSVAAGTNGATGIIIVRYRIA